MSRYIDADAVITAIAEFNKYEDELEYPYASDDLEEYKDDARLLIEDIPTIDIVRCKECRKSHIDGKTTHYLWCTEWGRSTDTFGYCERGEREGE